MRIRDIETRVDARLEEDCIHLYVNDFEQIDSFAAEVEEGDCYDLVEVIDELANHMTDYEDLDSLKLVSRILKDIRARVKERISCIKDGRSHYQD